MASFLLLISFFVYHTTFSKEKDIYHVITGESDMPHTRNLDPVYYVGIYDKKPPSLPTKYEIELMTADSGKRFTCIIPKDNGEKDNEETSNTQDEIIENEKEEIIKEEETFFEEEDELFEEEAIKTPEELLQEVDTLENRDRYIQEIIAYNKNSNNNNNNKKNKKIIKKRLNNNCFFSREGYWNYELCLYDKIRQFHGNKNKRNPNIKLGDFNTYIDVSKILMNDINYPYLYLKDIYGIKLFENTEKHFIHLLYTDGQDKRESIVSVQCSQTYGKRTKDGIIKISEPKIHKYHFTIIYKAVCEYINWLQKEYNIYDNNNGIIEENIIDNNNDILDSVDSGSDLLIKKGIDPNSDDISLLLSPLLDLALDNKCLLLKQGWWTVEFCYGKFIRQIHLEAKKQKNKKGQIIQSLTEWDIKQEHVTGRWNENEIINKESFNIHKNENDPSRTYASIIYNNGDECDLNKQKRQTEIQFICSLNNKHSQLIKSREDPSCYYIAQIETPLLCRHPDFKIPTPPKYQIICYPFHEMDFIKPASLMKEVADIQSETDLILKMVTTAARENYLEKQENENEKKENNDNVVDKDKNEQSEKHEL